MIGTGLIFLRLSLSNPSQRTIWQPNRPWWFGKDGRDVRKMKPKTKGRDAKYKRNTKRRKTNKKDHGPPLRLFILVCGSSMERERLKKTRWKIEIKTQQKSEHNKKHTTKNKLSFGYLFLCWLCVFRFLFCVSIYILRQLLFPPSLAGGWLGIKTWNDWRPLAYTAGSSFFPVFYFLFSFRQLFYFLIYIFHHFYHYFIIFIKLIFYYNKKFNEKNNVIREEKE